MPIPSLPQPISNVATSTVVISDSDSVGSSETTDETVVQDDNQTATQTTTVASVTQDEVTEEVSETQMAESKTEAGKEPTSNASGEETIATPPAIPPRKEADIVATPNQAEPPKDILQDPVISKTQPSQAVLAAVAPTTQGNPASAQQSAVVTNPSGDKNNEVVTSTDISTATLSTLAMVDQPTLKTIPPAKSREVPEYPVLTANDRVQNAIKLLNNGNEQRAEKELADALVIEPNNRTARRLMQQLHESPSEYFKEDERFDYVVRPNETLIGIAEKFLDDPLDFYMLAKLNDIKFPNSIVSGKALSIPGEQPFEEHGGSKPSQADSVEVKQAVPKPVKTEEEIKIERAKVYYAEHRYQEVVDLLTPYINKKPASKYAPLQDMVAQSYSSLANDKIKKGDLLEAQAILETSMESLPKNNSLKTQLTQVRNTRESERLYRLGVQESQTGKQDQAIKTFAKALQLNPAHKQAKKQITDLRLTVVENYHKQAMVLYRKQDLVQAIKIWDNVLQLDPNHELAKQYRARALELQRKIEQL